MPTKKIADLPNFTPCQDKEHNPPMYEHFEAGIYEHTCPSCGKVKRFKVDKSPSLEYDDESPDYISGTEDGI